MKVLAGDIGGTKTLLQIADVESGRHRLVFQERFASAEHGSFFNLVTAFLQHAGAHAQGLEAACIGVAGPVHNGKVKVTYLPWQLDAAELQQQLDLSRVVLINDFQAVGYGIELLRPDDLVTLQHGEPQPHGVRAVLGAGTGLGEAILVWQQGRYHVLATEGGHSDFAPVDELQVALWRFLHARHGRVSIEKVLSGPGLVNVFDFLCAHRHASPGDALRHAIFQGDPAAAISAAALAQDDPLAVAAMDLFVRIYGAHAGNLALMCIPAGGLYIAGGIAPKIVERMREPAVIDAFRDKEPMSALLRAIPVHVVTNPEVGLLGAAAVAAGGDVDSF